MPNVDDWIRKYASDNRSIRIRAAKALLERGEDVPLTILIDILVRLSHDGLGWKAVQVLVARKDDELDPAMIELLQSDDPWLREAACQTLGHSSNSAATKHLLRMFGDAHVMVRRAAGFGLAFLKDPASIDQLRALYERHKHDDINVVMALECALKSLGDNRFADTEGNVERDETCP